MEVVPIAHHEESAQAANSPPPAPTFCRFFLLFLFPPQRARVYSDEPFSPINRMAQHTRVCTVLAPPMRLLTAPQTGPFLFYVKMCGPKDPTKLWYRHLAISIITILLFMMATGFAITIRNHYNHVLLIHKYVLVRTHVFGAPLSRFLCSYM